MMRRFVLLASLLLLIVVSDLRAQCDCVGEPTPYNRGSSFATAYDELVGADMVFYGQVIAVRKVGKVPNNPSDSDYEAEVFFSVERVWKIDVPDILRLRQTLDGCITNFNIGHRWLVYGRYDKAGLLRTSFCSRSRTADRKPDLDMDEFGKKGLKESRKKKTQESVVIDMPGR